VNDIPHFAGSEVISGGYEEFSLLGCNAIIKRK
jgi:hypothetical protein